MSLTQEQKDVYTDAIVQSQDWLQTLIAFQAENDDEFDISTRLTTAQNLPNVREYKGDMKEILQDSLNSKSPIPVKITDQIICLFEVTPIYEHTRDYIRDPFNGPLEPHDMHLNEDKIKPSKHDEDR